MVAIDKHTHTYSTYIINCTNVQHDLWTPNNSKYSGNVASVTQQHKQWLSALSDLNYEAMNADIFIQLLDYTGQLPTYETQQLLLHLCGFHHVRHNTKMTPNAADIQHRAKKGFNNQ